MSGGVFQRTSGNSASNRGTSRVVSVFHATDGLFDKRVCGTASQFSSFSSILYGALHKPSDVWTIFP